MNDIDVPQLGGLLASGEPYLIVDVGTPERFLDKHIPTSIFMEHERAAASVERWVEAARSVAIVICDDDGQGIGRTVAEQARMRGFVGAVALTGGVAAWLSAGQPSASGWMSLAHGLGKTMMERSGVVVVSPAEVEALSGPKTLILDVRTAEEYARATIPGSRLLAGSDLLAAADALRRAPVDRIVVHCAGRTRGAAASALLSDLGLTNVLMFDGGTQAWAKAGKHLVEGAFSQPAAPDVDRSGSTALRRDVQRLSRRHSAKLVSAASLAKRLAGRKGRPTYVVDTRTREEYEAGHVPGSLWMLAGEIANAVDDLVPVRNAHVTFVSNSGVRATLSDAHYCRLGGFKSSVLRGGIHAWRSAGLALESGHPAALPTTARDRERARILAARGAA